MYYVGYEITGGSICLESGIVCSKYSVQGFGTYGSGFIKKVIDNRKKILNKISERKEKRAKNS